MAHNDMTMTCCVHADSSKQSTMHNSKYKATKQLKAPAPQRILSETLFDPNLPDPLGDTAVGPQFMPTEGATQSSIKAHMLMTYGSLNPTMDADIAPAPVPHSVRQEARAAATVCTIAEGVQCDCRLRSCDTPRSPCWLESCVLRKTSLLLGGV